VPAERESHASHAGFRVPGLGLLWLALAAGYLAASASGHRAAAVSIVGLMVGALVSAAGRPAAGVLSGLVLAGACLYWSDSVSFVAYVPPLAAFGFMAYFFHRTLGPGAEPLITRVARTEHPDLPADMARYTRTLTRTWSLCFVLLFLAALLSAPVLTLGAWSRWVQGLGYLVPTALFLGEYAYRHYRFRGHRHGSIAALILNIVAVFGKAAVNPHAREPKDRERC
jgi:uncharacterized membrane protein